jgi:prepilin-type N-terminal cleavage/methylation domain-containing protein
MIAARLFDDRLRPLCGVKIVPCLDGKAAMRRDAGYTLIEVLIMLAITALLAATVLETVRATSQNGVRIERAARTATQDFSVDGRPPARD